MRKSMLLILIIVSIILFLSGCSAPTTIKEALKKVDIEPEEIYSTDTFNNIVVAFYKDKKSGHQTAGIFYKENNSIYFIIQNDLEQNLSLKEEFSVCASVHVKNTGDKFPEYSFQYGVIKNPQIKNVKLIMTDGSFEDRYAKIIEIDGLRVWYTCLNIYRIFNVQQGLSKEGKIIYSNLKY